MSWGSIAEVIGQTFDYAGLPEGRLDDLPMAPPPPAPPSYPGTTPQTPPYPGMPWPAAPAPSVPLLTADQVAKLKYMGIDPAATPPEEISRILGLTPPPQAPPAPKPPAGSDPAPDPAGSPEPAGKAADADAADAKQAQAVLDELAALDKTSATTLDEIHSAGVEGRKQLDNIQKDVEAKMHELGPKLGTPEGDQQLRDFLKEKLTAAKQIIDKHISDAEDAARKTHDMAHKYDDLGTDTTKPDTSTSDTSSDPPPAPASTEPAAATAPAAAAPAAASPMTSGGMPMMPGGMPMGGMPSMGGLPIPSFGGGSPGMGGGDPFSGGGSTPHGDPVGFHDQQQPDQSGSGTGDSTKFHDATDTATHNGSDPATQPAASPDPGASPQHSDGAVVAAHDDKSTDVKLPDGSIAHARNGQEAAAARAAVGGATVADAYKSVGIDLPPPGTPVTDPLPPPQLQAGDIGMSKDHLVMALGGGKVLVNGQVQPQDSLGSGPDFLGWFDPTKNHTAAAPPAPVPAPPPVPS